MAGKGFFKNKEELRRKMIVGGSLFVGFIFLFGIVATALFYQMPSDEANSPKDYEALFSSAWVHGELLDEEKAYLINTGRTIVTYHYTGSPGNLELEGIISDMKGQAILERIPSEKKYLRLESFRGETVVNNLAIESIYIGLCDVLYYPPPDCAVFQ
jgi:hypothetical protein